MYNDDDDDDDDNLPLATKLTSPILIDAAPPPESLFAKENDKNSLNNVVVSSSKTLLLDKSAGDAPVAAAATNNTSFSSQFAKMSVQSPSAEQTIKKQMVAPVTIDRPTAFGERKSTMATEHSKISMFKNINKSATVIEAGGKSQQDAAASDKNDETPMRAAKISNFETPYSLQWQVPPSRCPPLRSKSDMHTEFQSKKILFTTPKTNGGAGCPPPLCSLSNDLSLIESPYQQPPPKDCAVATTKKTEDEKTSITINGQRFFIGKKIGSGGSSAVFLAQSVDFPQTNVAIKVGVVVEFFLIKFL